MQDLEKRSVTNNNDIKTWNRYVDDVLATVKKDKTDDILHTINNTTAENIKFTKEEEDNNQLAFLDILLTRTDDGTINTQVYSRGGSSVLADRFTRSTQPQGRSGGMLPREIFKIWASETASPAFWRHFLNEFND
jgi:hypothetical protein